MYRVMVISAAVKCALAKTDRAAHARVDWSFVWRTAQVIYFKLTFDVIYD